MIHCEEWWDEGFSNLFSTFLLQNPWKREMHMGNCQNENLTILNFTFFY